MSPQPLVSIIIPTYNRADLIEETLNSIIAQTYKHWECIVVDDGSSDNTLEILKKYSFSDARIKFYKRPQNYKSGGNGARNYGLYLSKGEFINWFDSDDLMHEEKLEKQVQQLLETPILHYSVCNTYIFEHNVKNIIHKRSEYIYSENNCFDYISLRNVFLTNAVLWRKSLIEGKYTFNEDLKAAQEWEFNSKVLLDNPNYLWIQDCLVFNRKHENSISYNVETINERKYNYIKARRYVLDYIEEHNIQNVEITKYLRKCLLEYSYDLIKVNVIPSKLFSLNYYKLLIKLSYLNRSLYPLLRGSYWIVK